MKKAAKTRVFLLLLAAVATLLALTPPKPAKACLSYEIETCYERSTRSSCSRAGCPSMNNCDGSETSCVYWKTMCC
jgi:hypothetical protein